jgi:hypothetical protein
METVIIKSTSEKINSSETFATTPAKKKIDLKQQQVEYNFMEKGLEDLQKRLKNIRKQNGIMGVRLSILLGKAGE